MKLTGDNKDQADSVVKFILHTVHNFGISKSESKYDTELLEEMELF